MEQGKITEKEATLTAQTIVKLSVRSLAWLLTSTILTIGSFFAGYSRMMEKMSAIEANRLSDERYHEVKDHDLESKVEVNTVNIRQNAIDIGRIRDEFNSQKK